MSNISVSLLTTLTHHIASISEFEQVFTFWFSTAGVVLKIRKFKVHNSHALQQATSNTCDCCTCYSNKLHDTITMPRYCKDNYVNSFCYLYYSGILHLLDDFLWLMIEMASNLKLVCTFQLWVLFLRLPCILFSILIFFL